MAARPLLAGLLSGASETALAQYLALAPNSAVLLAPLVGKTIALRIMPYGADFYLCPTETGIQIRTEFSGTPDVTLTAPAGTWFKLGFGGSAGRRLFTPELQIDGDTEVARHFRELVENLDLDLEGHFSRLLSPGIAAAGAEALKSGAGWTRETFATFRQNLAEYWQEESRELPAKLEAEGFYAEVDRLRDDCERLEARILRLEGGPRKSADKDQAG